MSTRVLIHTPITRPAPAKELLVTVIQEVNECEREEPLFPNGGWDVHHHIFDPKRFRYAQSRHLTPPAASIEQYLDFKRKLGLTHSVLTHGLSYGDDCTSLETFVQELDRTRTFAIGVIDPRTVTQGELHSMHNAGTRGIRVNLYKYGAMHDVELQKIALRDHAAVIKMHCPGWSMAFTHIHPELWTNLKEAVSEIAEAGIPLVTDHFALLKARSMLPDEYKSDITTQPGFTDVMELVKSGALYVKISAPYRISEAAPCYDDIRPVVEALLQANPRRVVWGSDWPHTPRMKVREYEEAMRETPFLDVDDAAWLRSLKSWISSEEWELMMNKNPSELYGGS